MALYAVLIYAPAPADPMDITPEEMEGHERLGKFVDEVGGTIIDPQALAPSTTAKAVRKDGVADGPFLAGDAVLTGFFVLDVQDLDTALAVAKQIPARAPGGVEVRPLFTPPTE